MGAQVRGHPAVDAWVSPTNSRGRIDGGVDAVTKRHLGAGIQLRVQRAIRDRFAGNLPVGSAVCVPSGAVHPNFLISTPTMVESSQNVRETLNVALACAAAFQAVHQQNTAAPGSVRSVALVGMGARTGRVPARVCANLMWTGYTLFGDHRFEDYDDPRHGRRPARRPRERARRRAGPHHTAEADPLPPLTGRSSPRTPGAPVDVSRAR
ncbi:macro domain-containing protein [Streptomyces sp. JL4002]|uniref:macro domain-containing protein n=1 Tax=Streptomyces sp. JL4002 TaxID=3404781 RepID=UPI003B2855ED